MDVHKGFTEEQVAEIGRIKRDPLAFLKYVKIEEPGQLATPYELWPHLVEFYKALETYPLIDLIKSKKIGISWALATHALRKILTIPGWEVLEFSKGMVEAQELLNKSKVIYHYLPEWMKQWTVEPNSTERFGFKELGSQISAYPSTEAAGVGKTAGTVIHDEADFHEFYEINLSHTRATVADTKNGQLISVSTVDGTKPDSYFQRHWKAAEAGQNGFKALFYDVWSRPGRNQAFYDQLVRENEMTPWVITKNYPRTIEEALSPITAVSCFNKDVLAKLWNNAAEPETRQGFIYILCPPVVGTQYVAGVDVGEGLGQDYSALTIIGKQGLMSEVAAVIYINTLGTDSFAYEVDKLCREYWTPLLVIDNIGIGRAVSDKLVQLGYPRLYSQEAEEKLKRGSSITGGEKVGFALTRPNKRELVMKLVERINNGSLITRFKPMIKELMEYQLVKGYPEPTGRTHGDTVISLILAAKVADRIRQPHMAHMYLGGQMIW